MNKFKRTIMSCHGKSKTFLHWLYNTHSDNDDETEKVFRHNDLEFSFSGTGYRNIEKLIMSIGIPKSFLDVCYDFESQDVVVANENYILKCLYPVLCELQEEYRNDKKDSREKAKFSIQIPDGCMDKKSGCIYSRETGMYVLRMNFNVPLVNGISVNAKAALAAVKDILNHISDVLGNIDGKELFLWQKTYINQKCIRRYMIEHNICAFIADGSILPRNNGTEAPMISAKHFNSPESMRINITTETGETISGMAINKGITVITGGGYSGKSTLLNAIELGIYDHIPGDGREYVLSDSSALKTNAEDGRPVEDIDLTPFFRRLSGDMPLEHFCTGHASGSVSQAANIVEAICGEVKLLLIDEDKSATNFMIRDKVMRKIVPDEPIIPFTDRIEEIKKELGISVILVIGGSSEYLAHADSVILMRDFIPCDITDDVNEFKDSQTGEEKKAVWKYSRKLIPKATLQPFLYFRSVITENEKKIVLDDYSSDITDLTALTTPDRLNMLMSVMEKLLTDKEADTEELLQRIIRHIDHTIGLEDSDDGISLCEREQRFYTQIRPIDAWCCINRMRGVTMAGL